MQNSEAWVCVALLRCRHTLKLEPRAGPTLPTDLPGPASAQPSTSSQPRPHLLIPVPSLMPASPGLEGGLAPSRHAGPCAAAEQGRGSQAGFSGTYLPNAGGMFSKQVGVFSYKRELVCVGNPVFKLGPQHVLTLRHQHVTRWPSQAMGLPETLHFVSRA